MKIMTLNDLYLDQLRDMHSCERQLIKALPKMAAAASHPDLKDAFERHLEETRKQLERLGRVLNDLGQGPGRKVCEATAGLVEEGEGIIDADAEEHVRDAGLICAAQKIEHYEIASYGCLCTFASLLGRKADAKLLESTMKEEKGADHALTEIATNVVNPAALS
jgi:ferritin-like metal-binding protein YciE